MSARRLARHHLALAGLVAAYLALATAYGAAIPLWEAPDAIWHYLFAAHLAEGGGLPTRADEGVTAPWRQQGSQPPLYYLASAPLIALARPADDLTAISDAFQTIRYNPHANVGVTGEGDNLNRMVHSYRERWPWHGTVLAARLVGLSGLLWGLVAVLATWALARTVIPGRPVVALAATALVAFNPQFVFISTAISNDIAVTATSALALWAMAAVLRHGLRPARLVVLGAVLGLAALAKLSGLWLLPLAAAVVVWRWRRPPPALASLGHPPPILGAGTEGPSLPRNWERPSRAERAAGGGRKPGGGGSALLRAAVLVGLPALVVGGWWYVRNWLLFGDPTGLPLMLSVMTPRPAPPGARELAAEAVGVWKSFWAVFGWFNVIAPTRVYVLTTVITLVGLGGLVLAVARRKVPRGAWPGLLLAAVWVGLLVVALYLWARVRYPQGRMLFPAAPALALLVGAGWVLPWPERAGRWATAGLAMGLAALSAWLLPAVILPAYAAPVPLANTSRPHVVSSSPPWPIGQIADFDRVTLNVEPGAVLRTGQVLEVTIPWHMRQESSNDWSVFMHLVDSDGISVAQRDSYPGGGALPTSDWVPGMVVTDTHRITIPFTAGSPSCEDCRLIVGWYDKLTGMMPTMLAIPSMDPDSVSIQVADFDVEPARDAAGRPVLPAPVHFGDDIVLDGYDLHRRALDPGEKLAVTLFWRALRRPVKDYRASVQLRAGDRIVAQSDAAPADDARPTSGWQPGQTVADRHAFRVPEEVPEGDYTLEVLLFEPGGRPLPVEFRDFDSSLGPVRVTRPDG